jgi:hypothetical protein
MYFKRWIVEKEANRAKVLHPNGIQAKKGRIAAAFTLI